MTVLEAIACVVAVAWATASVAALPTQWRGENTFLVPETPTWWLWGGWAWRGWIRSTPTIVVGFAVAVVCMPLMLLFPTRSTGQIVAVAVGLGGFAFAFVIAASVTLLGRPRFLIPPHLRGSGAGADRVNTR
jgi:hypothetical protein